MSADVWWRPPAARPPRSVPELIEVPELIDEVPLTASAVSPSVGAAMGEVVAEVDRPQVQALSCALRHPNPVQAECCRVCGGHLLRTDPVLVPRPVLGLLRFSTGIDVLLDRPVVVGRAPRVLPVSDGEPLHLVRIEGTGHDLSRNHLQIRLEGWHVLVVDLGSRNGTVVAAPGRLPQLLVPRQPCFMTPGSLVTLADDVNFRYEAAP